MTTMKTLRGKPSLCLHNKPYIYEIRNENIRRHPNTKKISIKSNNNNNTYKKNGTVE